MNLPSIEELQRLLDERAGGTWRAVLADGEDWWNVQQAQPGGHYTPVAIALDQPDAELAALAPDLAAEVIRLRKEINAAKLRHVEALQGVIGGMSIVDTLTRSCHSNAIFELSRILEGDQP